MICVKIIFLIVLIFFISMPGAFKNGACIAQQTAPAMSSHIPAVREQSSDVTALWRLNTLHYWTGKTYSLTDAANRQAIVAFQKLVGLPRSGKLTDSTVARIMLATVPDSHVKLNRRHLEVDLDHQVLFGVDSLNQVCIILPVSTGNGQRFDYPDKGDSGSSKVYARRPLKRASTPRGNFKVYYKVSGWRKSPLGLMFDPMYITGGIAVHGDASVPPKPASHGCIRIPMFAAGQMFEITPIGTPVIVFGENPKAQNPFKRGLAEQ